jgi:uncharacterized repeat protein (TIGR01451 family)
VQVHCLCEAVAQRACCLATVESLQGASDVFSACLRIDAPTSDLTLSLVGLKNPVAAGSEVNYEVRVANHGEAPDEQVVVAAEIPEGMTVMQLGTRGPDSLLRAELVGSRYTFKPVPRIGAGESLTWKLRLRADQPGDVTLKVFVDSQGLVEPLTAEEQTTVLPEE